MSGPGCIVVQPSIAISLGSASFARSLSDALLRRGAKENNVALMAPGAAWAPPDAPAVSLVLILVAPTVADALAARAAAERWRSSGLAGDRIWPVLVHEGWRGGLKREAVEDVTGPLRAVLPFDPEALALGDNEGILFREQNRRSPLSRAIERLGDLVAQLPPSGPRVSSPASAEVITRVTTALWRRWRGVDDLRSAGLSVDHEVDREIDRVADAAKAAFSPADRDIVRAGVLAHVTGLGPLESLLADESINEIMVNGPDRVFVESGGRVQPAGAAFESEEQLRTVIDRVVGRAGRRVDLASPLCDVRWKDGSRVNVVLPPVALSGPSLTIRRFRRGFESLADLAAAGTITATQAASLRRAVTDRLNVLVAGNTGAGKTTLLNVLAGLIPAEERIVTLEDAAELRIDRPHVVRLETRARNTEGTGEITMADLLVNALRMRPDRIIVGECRGAEAVPMLQAMNTGHDGGLTTLHSNSAADALERLEAMVLLGAPQWPIEVVRRQIASAIDLVVYLKRDGGGRRLTEMGRVVAEGAALRVQPETGA